MPRTFATAIPSLWAQVGYQYISIISILEHAFTVKAYQGFGREECGRVLPQITGVLRDA
ncbi:hypothetical protein AAEP93_005193 [Penicillium crustosum]